MTIVENYPLSKCTTFRIGGNARYILHIESENDLPTAIDFAAEKRLPYFVLGNGSNVLADDNGYDGVILLFGPHFSAITVEGNVLHAQAGALLSTLAQTAFAHSLTGLEFAAGIPGSVGGAVTMNAGAYGGQIADVLLSCEVYTNGQLATVPLSEMRYGYRKSRILEEGGIVTGATFRLESGIAEEISAKMRDLAQRRREKQPLQYPSAGSVFKRPEGYFAGKLIEDAHLKGFSIGGAQVSEMHAGFIINRADATARDVRDLIGHIQKTVYEKDGVSLECEVRFLG